jgi:GntR family transcriptional regulator
METESPLYVKIAQSLRSDIEKELYNQGELLPTEDDLEKQFNASRTTIRNAISLLENEGLVVRKQGKGTIVQGMRATQKLNYISSLTEAFLHKSLKVRSSNVSIELIESPQKVVEAFMLDKPENVYLVHRTRVIDTGPVAFVTTYLLASKVPDFEEKADKLRECGLYFLLENEYNLKLHHAEESIRVYTSGPLEADILHLKPNVPLFHSVRKTFLDDGNPIEFVTSIIRADMYEFNVYLQGRPFKSAAASFYQDQGDENAKSSH